MTDKLLTRKQVCQLLGVHTFTVRRYEREGLVKPVLYIKRSPRYTFESLAGLVKEVEPKTTIDQPNQK